MSKTLIGSFYGDLANSAASMGWSAMQLGAKLKDVKDNADIERESERIKQSAAEFLKSLQFDRDHEGYGDKAKEWYEKAVSSLDDPDNTMSKRAKKQFKETYLPVMKEQVYGQIPALQNISIMTELKVDTERFADMIASDDNLSIDEAVHQYYLKLKGFGDQGLLNSGTIQKMVDDFRYETAPVKALQTLQKEYMANVINDKYNFSQQIAVVGGEAGLDASQQEALRKAAISFQTEWDKQLDLQFTEQKNVLLGDIAEAKDNKDFFALEIIDAMLDQVPARHKLELYKVKNTAMDNNDGLIKEELTRVVNNRQVPTEDNWGLLSYVANPYTRDEMTEDLAFAHGNAMVSGGASLTEARRAIDSLPGLSPGVRDKAKAKLTKDILDQEGDIDKIVSSMRSSAGYKAPTASKVPEVAYAGTVATISEDVPPIDVSQLVRKDEYIEEQQEAVTQVVLESQELEDLIIEEGLEEEDREDLAAEIAKDIVAMQVEEAWSSTDEETKKAITEESTQEPEPPPVSQRVQLGEESASKVDAITENVAEEAPALDASQIIEDGEYVGQQVETVMKIVSKSPEFSEVVQEEELDEEKGEALATEIAAEIVSSQIEEAMEGADEETKEAIESVMKARYGDTSTIDMPKRPEGYTGPTFEMAFKVDFGNLPTMDQLVIGDDGPMEGEPVIGNWLDLYLKNNNKRSEEVQKQRERSTRASVEQEQRDERRRWQENQMFAVTEQARMDEKSANTEELFADQARSDRAAFASSSPEDDRIDVPDYEDMTQDEIYANILQRIYAGEGKYITQKELAYIKDDALRNETGLVAGIDDSMVIDLPMALSIIHNLRKDKSVHPDKLKEVVWDFVDQRAIKAETAEKNNLAEKYSFVDIENFDRLDARIKDIANEAFPVKSWRLNSLDNDKLVKTLTDTAYNAVMMNPDLIGKDYNLLIDHLKKVSTYNKAKSLTNKFNDISKLMSGDSASKRIDNLNKSTVKTFMKDVDEGVYDLLLNPVKLQTPKVRASLKGGKGDVLEAVSKAFTGKSWESLQKEGNQWEKLQVMSNASFALLGGTLNKMLEGSLGIIASDWKLIDNQWAFKDSDNENMWFVYTGSRLDGNGVYWGIVSADAGNLKNMINLNSYVDPKLFYRKTELEGIMNDPLFSANKAKAEEYRKLREQPGTGGINVWDASIQREKDWITAGIEEEYAKVSTEIDEIVKDIMAYRVNLIDISSDFHSDHLRTRL